MSELKAEQWLDYAGEPRPCYHKSEADKVIAELKDKLQAACTQIENLINSASSIMLFQDRGNDDKCAELRHSNYKRCLAMAMWCDSKVYHIRRTPLCDMEKHEYWQYKNDFWQRWHERWLELAEKFKEGLVIGVDKATGTDKTVFINHKEADDGND